MILAGGEGRRLAPLTQTRSKPAVPFAGNMRIIDFVLNNFVNSDFLKIYVLTQFKSQSLSIHLGQAWHLSGVTDNFIETVPAQMRMGKHWYEGTADAIYQNIRFIGLHEPDNVCIFGGDHIYKMDVRQMVQYHEKQGADLTVCATRMPIEEASRFGVITVDDNYRMIGFAEKPANPTPLPDDPTMALVSMGNYVFSTAFLYQALEEDSRDAASSHDFGCDIIPNAYPKQKVYVYDFHQNKINNESHSTYWRDVGTLDTFWQTHMDLLVHDPKLLLSNPKWPLRSYHPPLPAAKIMADEDGIDSLIQNSIIAAGCEIEGARVKRSVLGHAVLVSAKTHIDESILLGKTRVGVGCRLRKVIADKGVTIEEGAHVGYDHQRDRARGLTVTDSGIVVISKGATVKK